MAAGVPAAPVNTLDRVFADRLVTDRGLVRTITHPSAGCLPLVASPIRMAGAEPEIRSHPPRLGEHTGEVLMDLLGYSPETIASLQHQGAIGMRRGEADEREQPSAPDR
jgi:crotonobetainyl-CoA:carnitine CoA-transferase CaiB-like acyl-CoA transferase